MYIEGMRTVVVGEGAMGTQEVILAERRILYLCRGVGV
jgi:hypothetical protein